ncbi:hypothetical protein LCGC14_2541600, partial [marine sediment metagenome]
MSRYTKGHYEDVARVLSMACKRVAYSEGLMPKALPRVREYVGFIAEDFANLFAADNPSTCSHCDKRRGIGTVCPSPCGEHHFEG